MTNQGIWADEDEIIADKLNAGLLQSDVIANQPAAGQEGRMFYATDELKFYRDNGVTWDELVLVFGI